MGQKTSQNIQPGAVFYTRMISPVPMTMGKEHSKFANSGDFIAIMLGYLANGQPMLSPSEIRTMNSEIGIVTLEDVVDALGQKQLDALNEYLRHKYEGK